jgi:hypothetical protein
MRLGQSPWLLIKRRPQPQHLVECQSLLGQE